MKNKKGFGGNGLEIFQSIFIGVLIISLGCLLLLYGFTQYSFPETAGNKCQEIGLELFDYDSGGFFTQSSITCINRATKEVIKIR